MSRVETYFRRVDEPVDIGDRRLQDVGPEKLIRYRSSVAGYGERNEQSKECDASSKRCEEARTVYFGHSEAS